MGGTCGSAAGAGSRCCGGRRPRCRSGALLPRRGRRHRTPWSGAATRPSGTDGRRRPQERRFGGIRPSAPSPDLPFVGARSFDSSRLFRATPGLVGRRTRRRNFPYPRRILPAPPVGDSSAGTSASTPETGQRRIKPQTRTDDPKYERTRGVAVRKSTDRRGLTRWGTTAAVAGLALASTGPAVAATTTPGGTRLAAGGYIVQASSESVAAAAGLRAGGTVVAPLGIVDGVDARLSRPAIADLGRQAGIQLSPDLPIAAQGTTYGGGSSAAQLTRMDVGPNWSPSAGQGVGVALIDTGVTNVPGIDPSHLVAGPDFSGEGTTADGYGHGTFMAGLIVGNGVGGSQGVPGVVPGATVVSVKVADSQGRTTLGQVIQGIGWAVENAQTFNIRVMSISLGASMPMNPNGNPLDAAVEAAWGAGIAVVAAAGNAGPGMVDSPGDAPLIITSGSETTSGPVAMPDWSSYSGTKPDVLAP